MGPCKYCDKKGRAVSDVIGYCAPCIRNHFAEVWPDIKEVHDRSRRQYRLPVAPPRGEHGRNCPLCMHRCKIPEGETGFCGLRRNVGGTITGGRPHEGNLSYYYWINLSGFIVEQSFVPRMTTDIQRFLADTGVDRAHPMLRA